MPLALRPWVEIIIPKIELPDSLRTSLCSLDYLHYLAVVGNWDLNIQIQGSPLYMIFDWLRKNGHYKDFGTCSFPSNTAVIGCLYAELPKLSPVLIMRAGKFHVLTCVEGKAANSNPNVSKIPELSEQCLILHESYANEPDKSMDKLTWQIFNVGGQVGAAILDFDTFFSGVKMYDRNANYTTWIHNAPVSKEMERIRSAMPSLAAQLEQLPASETDTLAYLMDDLVSSAVRTCQLHRPAPSMNERCLFAINLVAVLLGLHPAQCFDVILEQPAIAGRVGVEFAQSNFKCEPRGNPLKPRSGIFAG